MVLQMDLHKHLVLCSVREHRRICLRVCGPRGRLRESGAMCDMDLEGGSGQFKENEIVVLTYPIYCLWTLHRRCP